MLEEYHIGFKDGLPKCVIILKRDFDELVSVAEIYTESYSLQFSLSK